MAESNKYFVVKDRNDLSITYFEYDKTKGYDLHPRNVKIKDAIDVTSMVIINPSFIQKLAFRKVELKFQRLTKMLMVVLSPDNDDSSGDSYRQALNEINKLRLEILVQYKNKLKEKDFLEFNKRLDLLAQELNLRLYFLTMENVVENEYDRGRRGR